MANVWTYWKCPYCESIIRGDCIDCPNCGSPIPSNIKYMMPNNPEVIHAIRKGTVLTKHREIVTEAVTKVNPGQESRKANWLCPYCGRQNQADATNCKNCGHEKESADMDYFDKHIHVHPGHDPGPFEDIEDHEFHPSGQESKQIFQEKERTYFPDSQEPQQKREGIKLNWSVTDILFPIFIFLSFLFLIWFFFPITKTSTIQGFRWERTIDIEEYTLCHEEGWSLPPGAELKSQREEVYSHEKVLDHYETKTREVSYQAQDGYDISYKDLGNGQAEEIKVPHYVTKYRHEEYDEPVYKYIPIKKAKYYYDIGRWKNTGQLYASGNDHTASWPETQIPESVPSPCYGAQRQGLKTEQYVAIFVTDKGKTKEKKYNYSEWTDLRIGDTATYKTFRFLQ